MKASRSKPGNGNGPVRFPTPTPPAEVLRARSATQAALRSRIAELERTNAELEAFGHVIAHDLSEGLGTIALFRSTLEEHLGDELSREAARDLDGIRAGVERMWSLIGTTLESAIAPTRARRNEPVDANLVVGEAIASVEARVVQTGAAIVAGPMPWVSGDDKQLTRLFQNLLANSLKYRDPVHPPRIRIKACPQGRRWRFEVADNGIGIAPEVADRAFGRQRREHPEGGLGLAICRGIVTAHGGKIQADSRPHRGTTVSFDLPASEPQPPLPEGSPVADDAASPAPAVELNS